ncbi:hypothetical protein [Legionella qingyii]|uniref:hypothetical protein n=1 Tax=Legionella qingyii TaxID=2184757 RepID=UPI001F0C34A8|nr:hypothetical protein [Legionella qingyii]
MRSGPTQEKQYGKNKNKEQQIPTIYISAKSIRISKVEPTLAHNASSITLSTPKYTLQLFNHAVYIIEQKSSETKGPQCKPVHLKITALELVFVDTSSAACFRIIKYHKDGITDRL